MPEIIRPDGSVKMISNNKFFRRAYPDYYRFKKRILARDNYECVCCHKNKDLVIHHLDGYDKFPTKRCDETNAVTLCSNCHNNFHNVYGKGNNTKEQFEEWFKSVKDIVSKDIPNLPESRRIYCYETDTCYEGCTDLKVKLHLRNSHKKAIYECCNLKGNTFSVGGYHLIWGDVYNKMSDENEVLNYILTNFDNPRRHFVIDLDTGIIFNSCSELDRFYERSARSSHYAYKYRTFDLIIKHKSKYVLYCDYKNFSEEQKKILCDKKLQLFKGSSGAISPEIK